MHYQDEYLRRVLSIETALELIHDNDEVVTSLAGAEPVTLFNHLHLLKGKVKNVSVVNALMMGQYPFYQDPEMAESVFFNSWFFTWGPRKAQQHGTVSYVPMELHSFASRRMDYRHPNIFWGSASPMDKHGFMTLSLSAVLEREVMDRADLVVLEVNPRLPRVYGDTQVHISEVDHIVEAENPVPSMPLAEQDPRDQMIGQYAADLVEDGSTIQIGFGAIPGAVAQHLLHKKDLGVHTEILSDYILDLYEAGAVTNRRKTLWKGKFVADVGLGTRRLYDFLDDNPAVEFQPARIVNDPGIIRQNYRMVSINSALQVDLTGQCSAESIGPRLFSGTGGHKEFVKGSQDAPEGKSIIAFHATAKDDTVSRIVPMFDAGTAVTTSRVDVDYLVTEFGVACMRGRSLRERVRDLISISHPDFRDELKKAAIRLKLW